MKITLSVEQYNIDSFVRNVMSKYHFDDSSRGDIINIYSQMKDIIKPYAIYRINQKATGVKVIDDSQAAIVAMTLGEAVDELQEEYTAKGELDKAYIIDCVSNELLLNMYEEFNRLYGKYHRRYIKKYVFVGNEVPLTKSVDILSKINEDAEIEANEYGVLKPTKSVIFYALLSDNPNENCERICAGCNNIECSNRESLMVNGGVYNGKEIYYGSGCRNNQ
ncbi:MAG: hypothetical protein E7259_00905 [Lachnospiraceae bacterium]|nr:hypothetical protein [Lachnospiraceae bacterium]